jgi:transcriptional regulator with XRE-family HTH domain
METHNTAQGVFSAASVITDIVMALTPDQRWVLSNRIKTLSRIIRGEVLPTRVQLSTIEEFTHGDLSVVRDMLPSFEWPVEDGVAVMVRALREALGWDRAKLAEFCDVDISAVSRMESGRVTPRPATAARLVAAARMCEAPERVIKSFGVRYATTAEALALLANLDFHEVSPRLVVENVAIGRWVTARRRELEAGTCADDIRETLTATGVIVRRDVWLQRFAELQQRSSSANGVLRFAREDSLESWVSDQRRAFESGRLSEWKVEKLESVHGWRWGISKDDQWMATFVRVARAVDEAGLTLLPRAWKSDDGFKCGDWAVRARARVPKNAESSRAVKRAELLASLPPSS